MHALQTITVISLGGGVQSSVMALMADEGAFGPMPGAIFADTRWEPPSVYEHLRLNRGRLRRLPSLGRLQQPISHMMI